MLFFYFFYCIILIILIITVGYVQILFLLFRYIIPALVFMLFMFLWVMNFIVALGQMTLAGSFASYYWAYEKPKDVPAFPLTASFYRCIRLLKIWVLFYFHIFLHSFWKLVIFKLHKYFLHGSHSVIHTCSISVHI